MIFSYDRANVRNCLRTSGGGYTAYMNHDAVVELEMGLHWLSSSLPYGEDIGITSRHCGELPAPERQIGYCQIQLVEAHLHKKRGRDVLKQAQPLRHQPHGIYRPEYDRLDFYVSAQEVKDAYATVRPLGTENVEHRQGRVLLFGVLWVAIVKTHKRDSAAA
jgi:hypothetical protein